jgi:alpha-beta hydrolase superfamily lysophospholipase
MWDAVAHPRAAVHLLHGMADHAGRYARFASALNQAGLVVWAHDHRGHGRNPVPPVGHGHFGDADGWRLVIDDAARVSRRMQEVYPGLPLVLFGHSMGSFVAQALIGDPANSYAAVVLAGSGGPPNELDSLAYVMARLQRRVLGARRPGRWLEAMVFGRYNRHFSPNRTACDWLSRDEREVDRYIADPWCGFPLTAQSWLDFLAGRREVGTASQIEKIPKALPIHLISGSRDPVGDDGRGIRRLEASYRRAGLTAVSITVYEGARHELVNETNREEVTRDLIAWLSMTLWPGALEFGSRR